MNSLLQEQIALLKRYGQEYHIPIISDAGGRLLSRMVSCCRPQSVLEIGTAIGYSTLLMAAQSPPETKITTLELDSKRAQIARQTFREAGLSDRIRLLEGDAGQLITGLQDVFDLVFIDAAKGQYPDYLRKVRPLLSPCGVIIADNVLFRGWVQAEAPPPRRFRTMVQRLREYVLLVTTDPGLKTRIFRRGDGIAVSFNQGEKYDETT
ncbi:MAG TPA: O-methyltransferase [Patescibacteria group bacterium]|nr:O-methyltransferase [Patescibacteria group bacterium]